MKGLKGGIMGAFAPLFDRAMRLFVYSMHRNDNPNDIITTDVERDGDWYGDQRT